MKHWLIFSVLLATGVGALSWSEWNKVAAPVGPASLLNFVADVQREASRVPFRLTRLSDAEEISIGDQLAQHYVAGLISSQANPEETRRIDAYVEKIGGRVASGAKRMLPYKFHYIPNPYFGNAFALPGGHVFIGQGLLALMTSEDQLAAVLGHEIEHIDLYHCGERVQVEARTRQIPLGSLIALPVTIFQAGYSKNQELEADREGTWLAVEAGYSPFGAVHLFEKLEQMRREYVERAGNPSQELSQVAIEILVGYFRSHPLPAERIQQVQAMIIKHKWQNRSAERPLELTLSMPI